MNICGCTKKTRCACEGTFPDSIECEKCNKKMPINMDGSVCKKLAVENNVCENVGCTVGVQVQKINATRAKKEEVQDVEIAPVEVIEMQDAEVNIVPVPDEVPPLSELMDMVKNKIITAAEFNSMTEGLFKMKKDVDEKRSRIMLENAMVEIRSCLPILKQDRAVGMGGGKVMYYYASLENMEINLAPVLAKYGVHYTFTEKEEQRKIEISPDVFMYEFTLEIVISGYGAELRRTHTEVVNYNKGSGSSGRMEQTPSQKKQSAITSGKRALLEMVFLTKSTSKENNNKIVDGIKNPLTKVLAMKDNNAPAKLENKKDTKES